MNTDNYEAMSNGHYFCSFLHFKIYLVLDSFTSTSAIEEKQTQSAYVQIQFHNYILSVS